MCFIEHEQEWQLVLLNGFKHTQRERERHTQARKWCLTIRMDESQKYLNKMLNCCTWKCNTGMPFLRNYVLLVTKCDHCYSRVHGSKTGQMKAQQLGYICIL